LKDFRAGYVYIGFFAAIAILLSTSIIWGKLILYNLPERFWGVLFSIIFIISWISVTLLCWIIDDKIEKTHVKKKMTDIETNTPNQVMDRIKKALEMRKASKAEILTDLYALQANNSLSNFEFFDLIGETYQLNPKFFMLSIYPKIRYKFSKIYGDEGMSVMNKYILEKFCLDEGEQIIYELNGKIRQKVPKKYTIKILHGTIYVTNSRIIAHGKFEFRLYQSAGEAIFLGGSTKSPKKAKNAYFSSSGPCYGYQFPIKNLHYLYNYNNRNLSYSVKQDDNIVSDTITIFVSKKEHHGDKLFAILDKFQIRK